MGRKLLDIEVDELSIVDDAANQEPFILIKNQEGKAGGDTGGEDDPGDEGDVTDTTKAPGDEDENDDDAGDDNTTDEGGEDDPSDKGEGAALHAKLIKEVLGAIAECGKTIWATAPTLDINDDDAMSEFKKKVWAISDLLWQLRDYRDVTAYAKAATDAVDAGDPTTALDNVAKLLKVFGEGAQPKTKSETTQGDGVADTMPTLVKVALMDQEKLAKLIEGLVMVQEAMAGVDPAALTTLLNGLNSGDTGGDATGVDGNDDVTGEKEAGKAAELAKVREELAKTKTKLAKLQEENAKRSGTIQPPNGLNNEAQPKSKTKSADDAVVWGDDLAASKS